MFKIVRTQCKCRVAGRAAVASRKYIYWWLRTSLKVLFYFYSTRVQYFLLNYIYWVQIKIVLRLRWFAAFLHCHVFSLKSSSREGDHRLRCQMWNTLDTRLTNLSTSRKCKEWKTVLLTESMTTFNTVFMTNTTAQKGSHEI